MHLNYQHFPMVSFTRIQRNEMSYRSAISYYNRLNFSKVIHQDVFYVMYSAFSTTLFYLFFLKVCQIAFFFFQNFEKLRQQFDRSINIQHYVISFNEIG